METKPIKTQIEELEREIIKSINTCEKVKTHGDKDDSKDSVGWRREGVDYIRDEVSIEEVKQKIKEVFKKW